MCVVVDELEAMVVGDEKAEILPKESEGEGEEQRRVKRVIDPLLPSSSEVADHQLTHLPFRNWCPHCVNGRATEMGHRRQPRTERGLDQFHFDYIVFLAMNLAVNFLF